MHENKSEPDQLAESLVAKKAEAKKYADIPPGAFNEKNAAHYIGMSVSYLRHNRCHGDLEGRTPGPPFIKIGRTVRYLRRDLDCWLDQLRVYPPGSSRGEAAA